MAPAGSRAAVLFNLDTDGDLDSQSSLPLYFGLGDDTAVTRVEVRWPSGRTQVITQGIKVNETLRIREQP